MANHKSYYELLKDPRWQRKRLEVMQRDEFRCAECGNHVKTLNVHHIRYRRGKKPWEYDDGDLVTLCEDCHKQQTKLRERLEATLDPSMLGHLVGYATGLQFSREETDAALIESYEEAVGFVAGTALPRGSEDRLIDTLLRVGCVLTRESYKTLVRAEMQRG